MTVHQPHHEKARASGIPLEEIPRRADVIVNWCYCSSCQSWRAARDRIERVRRELRPRNGTTISAIKALEQRHPGLLAEISKVQPTIE